MIVRDLAAGLSVAGLMLPEAVAYAGIAGLPPQRAIAAAVAGCLIYAVVGRSRFAVVSPTSSSAAILAAILAAMPVGAGEKVGLATLAIAMSGLIFLVAWGCRLGLLTGFISRPVLRGFSFGLGLTIVIHQIPAIVDVPINEPDLLNTIGALIASIRHWNLVGIGLAAGALFLLVKARRKPALPGAFLVVMVASILSWAGETVGLKVPSVGLITLDPVWPDIGIPGWAALSRLSQLTLPLVLILFAESWGTMRALALRHGDSLAPDRELAALGVANLLSALVQGMPVGAGFSAGSANEAAGATSRWAAVSAGVGLALLMALGAPLIAHLPKAVLAVVVIAAVSHAFDPRPFRRLWRIDRDQWVAIGAAVGVPLFGVVNGMMLAIVFSIGALLRRLAVPQIARLGCIPGTRDFADLSRHPDAIAPPGIGIWRPSEALFFANAERIFGMIGRAAAGDPKVRVVVLSLEESMDLDSTALDALLEADARLRTAGLRLRLARARDPLRDLLRAVGADDLVARSSYSVDEAVKAALTDLANGKPDARPFAQA